MTSPMTPQLRGPDDLAECIPYELGYQPENSIVLAGIAADGRMQGIIRVSLTDFSEAKHAATAALTAITEIYAGQRAKLPHLVIAIYRDTHANADRSTVVDGLARIAESLIEAAIEASIEVLEAIFVVDGRWSSFDCTKPACCPPEGRPVRGMDNPGPIGTALIAAGRTVASSRSVLEAKIRPAADADTESFDAALSSAAANPLPKRARYDLLRECLADAASGGSPSDEQAALLLIALEDREFRDLAMTYSEAAERPAAGHLWQGLAARIGARRRYLAAAPLTLLSWNCWLDKSATMAVVALREAQDVRPGYRLADLLNHLFITDVNPAGTQDELRRVRAEYEFEQIVDGHGQANG
ncbi:DUF4192 domain-containing protein [Kitasatospora purpeofusca]|uniref:DUF4192 domain-containing protein n=1 Tax=Kitasatospora purpeofusca TaxID=67352 RepID=UPI0036E80556